MEKIKTQTISVKTERSFAASHILEGVPKCKNLHGHNWKVEITITGKPEHLRNGMVVNFSDLKAVVDTYDHKHLNDFIDNPTAENIAIEILNRISEGLSHVDMINVVVWESDKSCAIATEN